MADAGDSATASKAIETLTTLFGAGNLEASVGAVASALALLFSGLAATGVLAMVMVNLVKILFEPRRHLHRWFVLQEMYHGLRTHHRHDEDHVEEALDRVEDITLELTTGGDPALLYRLATEQLVGQLKAAANIATSWPSFPRKPTNGDGAEAAEPPRSDEQIPSHREVVEAWGANLRSAEVDAFCDESLPVPDGFAKRNEFEAHVLSIIDANLAGLQLRIEYWWTLFVQLLAISISTGTILILVEKASIGWALFAIWGGMLAPFSHDLATSLRGIATKPSK